MDKIERVKELAQNYTVNKESIQVTLMPILLELRIVKEHGDDSMIMKNCSCVLEDTDTDGNLFHI